MVKPLHRKQIITRARYHPMMTQPSGDWSVFKQIFADSWEPFQRAHPRYQTSYYDGLVAKMLACGNPEKMGYIEYRCPHCGQGKHLVSMSCKSSLCLRCAKVYVDNWVNQVSKALHAGVIYRHIILTVPAMFTCQGKLFLLRHPAALCVRTVPSSYRPYAHFTAILHLFYRSFMTRSSAPLYTLGSRIWTKAALPQVWYRRCTGCETGYGCGVSVRIRPDDLRRVSSPQAVPRLHLLSWRTLCRSIM